MTMNLQILVILLSAFAVFIGYGLHEVILVERMTAVNRANLSNLVFLNPQFLHNSVLNFGQLKPQAKSKLLSRQCLKIGAFGGSATCGLRCCQLTTTIDNIPDYESSWSQQLLSIINEKFPCRGSSNHSVTVNCASGMHTTSWIQSILIRQERTMDIVKNSDILLFDTALNDLVEGYFAKYQLHERLEILVRLIHSINPAVSVMWVDVSSRNRHWTGELPRPGDASHLYKPLMKHYDVPHISAIDGLGPLHTDEAKSFYQTIYRVDDCCHPSVAGHRIIATMTVHFLMLHASSYKFPLFEGESSIAINKYVEDPAFVSKEDLSKYLNSQPLSIVFNSSESLVRYEEKHVRVGWEIKTDKPTKPVAFISDEVGAFFRLYFTEDALRGHRKSNIITVEVLRTYESIGVLNVTVYSNSNRHKIRAFTTLIDCYWISKVSEPEVTIINLHGWGWDDSESDLVIEFNNTAIDNRRVHKVKLFSVAIF